MNNRFSRWPPWQPSSISDWNDFSYIYIWSTSYSDASKFWVNWPFVSGEAKNRFSRWPPWQLYWISDQKDFSYFLSTSFLPCFESIGLSVQEEKRKIDFQDGRHLGFLIRNLPIFDLQVILTLPTKFQINWLFGSAEEAKNRFSRWRPSWISDQNDFSYFLSTSHPDDSYQVSNQLPFQFRRSENIFKMAAMATILDCQPEQ